MISQSTVRSFFSDVDPFQMWRHCELLIELEGRTPGNLYAAMKSTKSKSLMHTATLLFCPPVQLRSHEMKYVSYFFTSVSARSLVLQKQLPELSALKRTIEQTNENISKAHEDVEAVVNMSLTVNTRMEYIRAEHVQIDRDLNESVAQRIENILDLLTYSRQLLSTMTMVRKFNGSTVVNPLAPSPVLERTQYASISLQFKPASPDGLLFFIGDSQPAGAAPAGQCVSDFAAVEMRNRKVHFAMCVGATYVDTAIQTELQVDDESWYKIQATL